MTTCTVSEAEERDERARLAGIARSCPPRVILSLLDLAMEQLAFQWCEFSDAERLTFVTQMRAGISAIDAAEDLRLIRSSAAQRVRHL